MGRSDGRLKVCFTGHRPDKLGGYEENPISRATRAALGIQILELVEANDHVTFVSGMAIGVDTWAAIEVLKVRLQYPDKVALELAIPFVGQQNKWPLVSQMEWLEVYRQADSVEFVDEEGYAPWKLLNRNKWMVDNCDLTVAVWNGEQRGGTAHCIRYASRKDKEIINLWHHIHTANKKKIKK